MNHLTKILILTAAAFATLTLPGCASDNAGTIHSTVIVGHPDLSRFSGRAFVLRRISTNYLHHFEGEGWDVLRPRHCLPDWAYQKELRYDVNKIWKYYHLGQGSEPAVPVDIVIRVLEASHGQFHGRNLLTDIHIQGATFRTKAQSGPVSIFVPMWATDRWLIPPAAEQIGFVVKSLQKGNPEVISKRSDALSGQWGGPPATAMLLGGLVQIHTRGVGFPMIEAEMEQATGLTADQLSALCDKGGGK
ncbi:MAG: hypothetical protein B7Z66_12310 [Chromatiales bacterium 21-64-14]|nr:MAG: hypothetical protein B7Z66_12310 [Chromatiales bacterium 21-64-14]HQU15503.1 hypothetical protein [Gammaproteobacteria bacterium]